jgi:hypothetical protein
MLGGWGVCSVHTPRWAFSPLSLVSRPLHGAATCFIQVPAGTSEAATHRHIPHPPPPTGGTEARLGGFQAPCEAHRPGRNFLLPGMGVGREECHLETIDLPSLSGILSLEKLGKLDTHTHTHTRQKPAFLWTSCTSCPLFVTVPS